MASDDTTGRPDPKVVRRMTYENLWPADKPLPLTPMEA